MLSSAIFTMTESSIDYYQERQDDIDILIHDAVVIQNDAYEEEENLDSSTVSWHNLRGDDPRMVALTGVTCEQFLTIFNLVVHVMPVVVGRGRRSRVSHHDKLIITLFFLKYYETLEKTKETFQLSKSYLSDIINTTIERISPILYEYYVERYEPGVPDHLGDFPEARYIINTIFQPIWTPLGTYLERKKFYSRAHKQYGLKTQCLYDRSGRVVHCVAGVPGSVRNLSIVEQIKEDAPLFIKTEDAVRIKELLVDSIERSDRVQLPENAAGENSWSIIAGLEYQGLEHIVPAVLPVVSKQGEELTREERDHNKQLLRSMRICKHFHDRMKLKWRIMATKYRNDRSKYSTIFKLCCALTYLS